MRVLVLGGGGFIGPRVMAGLVERSHEVGCMDVNTQSPLLAPLKDQVKLVRGDVTLMDDVMKAMLETKPDRVLNLAYALGAGEGDPHAAVRLNILGMDNCFEAARLCGVRRVVYASSLAVYGRQSHFGERAVTEEDPPNPDSLYGVCKAFNERQADWYNKAYQMSITGVRPANVTGPDKVRGSVDHVQCITLPARGQPAAFPNRDTMRLPIHVDDIADVFVRVTIAETTSYPIYNSGGHPVSLGELANQVREFLPDAEISFQKDGGREESGLFLMDNTRLRQEFEVEYQPFRQRVLQIINDVRREEGLPLIEAGRA